MAQAEPAIVRIVVPAPPGGSLDGGARVLARSLSAITGEPHVVENRPGANTLIGWEHVLRAPADGRTLLYAGVITTALLQKISFSPLEDLRPVIAVASDRYALIGSSRLPATSARDLAAAAHARPGGLNCAAPPGPMALACEQLKARLNGALMTVPYAGVAPALAAVAGGHADITFVPLQTAGKLVDAKLAHVLGVSRGPALSGALGAGAPVLDDIWPGFVLGSLQGIYVPGRTPDPRVRQLNRDLARVLVEPEVMAQMRTSGQDPEAPDTPEMFTARMRALYERYGTVVEHLGLRAPQ